MSRRGQLRLLSLLLMLMKRSIGYFLTLGRIGSRRYASPRQFCSFHQHQQVKSISSDAESTSKSYAIRGSTSASSESGVVMTTNTNHSLRTDVPVKMGGKNEAPQPVEMLLAAFIGCTQATAIFVGRQMKPDRLLIDRMEFDIQAFRDERGAISLPLDCDIPVPSRLLRISGTIVVHAANQRPISEETIAILKEQTEQRCPVANMIIASGCAMVVCWKDGSIASDDYAALGIHADKVVRQS